MVEVWQLAPVNPGRHTQVFGLRQIPWLEHTFVFEPGTPEQIGTEQAAVVQPAAHVQLLGALQVPCPPQALGFVEGRPKQTGIWH